MLITSRSNPLIIETASLKEKKYRERSSLFIFEGVKLFDEAVKRGVEIVRVFATEKMTEYCKNSAFKGEIITVSDSVYEKLSNEKAPEGIICVAKYIDKSHNMNKIYNKEEFENSEKRVIILSSLRDPGNLGTVIRSASAFGVDEIIMSSDCADIYNPKTVRAAMGTLFSQSVSYVDDLASTVKEMNAGGYITLAAVLDDNAKALNDVKIGKKTAFIIGNEGHGIAPDVIESASGTVYIPMAEGVESLNAAIAASVFMWQAYKG
ncbi:MAG: RNA methyltransferase [Clostridia bacterium]|nr:RNA methyltransferase [Clostridia bacterium]